MKKQVIPASEKDTQQVSVRLPASLWKRIRRLALDRDVSAQQIVTEQLEKL